LCLTRVGKVMDIAGTNARVRFLDTKEERSVDVTAVEAKRGSYVEVFATSAISRITKREAELKASLRVELLRRTGRIQ